MPLVIAVLVIIVVFLNAKDYKKRDDSASAIYEKDRRKTNAKLEQYTMDMYMKHGYSADDAFRKSYEDMISAGYEPCIPRSAYGKNSSHCKGRYGFDVEYYDSFLVRDRRKDIKEEWKREHPSEEMLSEEEIEVRIYQNFPKNNAQYIADLKRRSKRSEAKPIGTFIIYPGLGTCEIIAYNWIGDGTYGGTYTLRVLKTGKIVTYVKIGDSKIKSQSR